MENAPEFLQIFQQGGPYAIKIIFEDHEGKVCDQNMKAEDFCKLIDSASGLFYESIYVDDWLFRVRKYEIDPAKKKIAIKVRKLPSL